jgi:hypothetical protein
MSQTPLTPTRRGFLKVYVACCKKAERRIRGAFAPGLTLTSGVHLSPRERAHRLHILETAKSIGVEPYALALRNLRVARSKFAAELEGLPWS